MQTVRLIRLYPPFQSLHTTNAVTRNKSADCPPHGYRRSSNCTEPCDVLDATIVSSIQSPANIQRHKPTHNFYFSGDVRHNHCYSSSLLPVGVKRHSRNVLTSTLLTMLGVRWWGKVLRGEQLRGEALRTRQQTFLSVSETSTVAQAGMHSQHSECL